jgi:hypothetical protein
MTVRENLPDFLIIGAAKSGTTTLHDLLDRHPALYMSPVKEPSFFSYQPGAPTFRGWNMMRTYYADSRRKAGLDPDPLTEHGDRPPQDLDWSAFLPWYQSLFAPAAPGQLRAESTTNYTQWPQWPDVPARLASLVPGAKLIYIMRHPVDRAYSHYIHRHVKEVNPGAGAFRPFDEFVTEDPICLDCSDYWLQVEQYLKHFPREAFLFLDFEELKGDLPGLLAKVFRFLGVEERDLLKDRGPVHLNQASDFRKTATMNSVVSPLRNVPVLRTIGRMVPKSLRTSAVRMVMNSPLARRIEDRFTPPPMRPETRRQMLERFRERNQKVRELTGLDLAHWDR